MLKRTMVLLSILLLATGCLSKRQVLEENLFQSSIPSLMIKVAPQFTFIGKENSNSFSYGETDTNLETVPEQHETFYFAEIGRNHIVERLVLFNIGTLLESDWYYIDDFENWWEDALLIRKSDFGGRQYQAAYSVLTLKGGDIARYFNAKSFFLPDCYALKVLYRLPSENHKVTIWFAEACQGLDRRLDLTGDDEDQKRDTLLRALDESFASAMVSQQ